VRKLLVEAGSRHVCHVSRASPDELLGLLSLSSALDFGKKSKDVAFFLALRGMKKKKIPR